MAAAPKTGTLMFKGVSTGRSYAMDFYISDVAAAQCTFDNGSGAGANSLVYWN